MTDAEKKRCPQCGAELSSEGLCASCLMKQGLAENTEGFSESTRASGGRGWQPLTVEQIQPYFPELEILELLGRGGMGAVYKARQKNLDRYVALKILPPQIAPGSDSFAERFTREAQALARLSHPHIVTIHDFGCKPGQSESSIPGASAAPGSLYFFVMEYVDGLNLRQVLDGAKMTPDEALAIVPQICEALQYAHDQGIVHRDIKPENILLNKQGRVKIADFGLAKLVGASAGLEITNQKSQIENTGILGTPNYMAPEQRDHPSQVDHRADIYALGVVFYQMLTGELPTPGSGHFQPPSKKVQIDVRLDEVVLRALEREPSRRYQHVSEIQTEVETIVSSPQFPGNRTSEGATDKDQHHNAAASFSAAASSGAEPRFSRTAIIGAVLAVVGVSVFSLLRAASLDFLGVLLISAGPIASAILCGIVSISQIRHSAGRLYGLGLAMFDALFFSLLVLDGLLLWSWRGIIRILIDFYSNPSPVPPGLHVSPPPMIRVANMVSKYQVIVFLIGVVVVLVLDSLIIRWAWRAANRPVGQNAASRPGDPWSAIRREQGVAVAVPSAVRPPRKWWKRWWVQVIAAVVISLVVRALVMPTYVITGNAMAPELPAGSRILVWKLSSNFAPGDLIAYHDSASVKVGRVVQADDNTVVVNRNSQPDESVDRSRIIGKVFSVFWRGKEDKKSLPVRSKYPKVLDIGSTDASVLVVHDDVDLHYAIFYAGDLGGVSTGGSANTHSLTWIDKGSLKLNNGRTFSYLRESVDEFHLDVNGQEFDLRQGRVLVLHDEGTIEQIKMFPSLTETNKASVLAKLITTTQALYQGPPDVQKLRGQLDIARAQLSNLLKTHAPTHTLVHEVQQTIVILEQQLQALSGHVFSEQSSPTQWLAEAGIDMNAMLDAAKRQHVGPDRISFIDALETLREHGPTIAATLTLVVNP
ncbi:MAG: protein kinase, partial [Phycisphaeraceae bacterium]